jgi:hypothetical protein
VLYLRSPDGRVFVKGRIPEADRQAQEKAVREAQEKAEREAQEKAEREAQKTADTPGAVTSSSTLGAGAAPTGALASDDALAALRAKLSGGPNLTEQEQVTGRYAKAIEQLGSDKLDVRIGGIHALDVLPTDVGDSDTGLMILN